MNRDVEQMILKAVDGSIAAEDFQRFQQLLRNNTEALERYCQEALLNGEVEWHYAVHRDLPAANQRKLRILEEVRTRQQRRLVKASFAIAAVLLLFLGLGSELFRTESPPVALRFSEAARHHIVRADGQPAGLNMNLAIGDTLIIEAGLAELTLPVGVHSIIEGPAILLYEKEKLIRLDRGRGFFHILTEEAKGFAVDLPKTRAVDIGTRFGVIAVPDQPSEVHVIDGQVKVKRSDRKDYRKLAALGANNSVLEDDASPTGFSSIPPRQFTRQLAEENLQFQLDFEKAGADGSFQSGNGAVARVRSVNGGVVQLVEGRSGKAARFDGTGSHLLVTGLERIYPHPGALTFWVRIPEGAPGRMLCPVSWGDSSQIQSGRWSVAMQQAPSDQRTIDLRPGSPRETHLVGAARVPGGKWNHVAFVFETRSPGGPEVVLYVNGSEDKRFPMGIPMTFNSDEFVIGTHVSEDLWASHGFFGDLDELSLHQKPLSAEEIHTLSQKPTNR